MAALTGRAISVARRASALYCATYGSGTPLLLIHGLGAAGTMFRPILPALAARYSLLVPDLRGHGQSRRLRGPHSVAQLTADISDLLDLLNVDSCFVLGHGTGGAVAQQLAHEHPARVRGLVLACSYACSSAMLRDQIARRLQLGVFGRARLADGAPQAVLPFDSRRWLGRLGQPALVIAGAEDTVTPPRHARELAGRLPDARLRLIPGAGHDLIGTHCNELLALTIPWLSAREVLAC